MSDREEIVHSATVWSLTMDCQRPVHVRQSALFLQAPVLRVLPLELCRAGVVLVAYSSPCARLLLAVRVLVPQLHHVPTGFSTAGRGDGHERGDGVDAGQE